MAKKKRPSKSTKKAAPLKPAAAEEAATRLHRLASELDAASKEAEAVAELVENSITEELSKHLVDDAANKKR